MGKFSSFEEIKSWQKAHDVTLQIYRITTTERFSKDFGLKDQIRRSAISIMANIAEGHGRRTNAEFANFLNIASGSVLDTQSHLYIAKGLDYIDKSEFNDIYFALEEISKMILALSKYLRENA
jgi:four helix bundle protein